MLNEELEKYKDMYAELVKNFVGLHNTHGAFLHWVGRDTGYATRKHLTAMSKLCDDMRRQGLKAYRKHLEIQQLEKKKLKEEKRNSKNKSKKKNDLVL